MMEKHFFLIFQIQLEPLNCLEDYSKLSFVEIQSQKTSKLFLQVKD